MRGPTIARLRRLGSLLGVLSDIRKFNNHVVARYGDLYFSELSPRVAGMNAGANIELVSVPGADYMHLGLREHHAFAGTVLGDDLLDLGDHLAARIRELRRRTDIHLAHWISCPLWLRSIEPHRNVPEVEPGTADERAHRHHDVCGGNAFRGDRPRSRIVGLGLRRIKPYGRSHYSFKLRVGHLLKPA